MQLLVVLGALSRDRRDGEYSLVDALVGGEEKRMAQWREVERQMLKMISGLTIAVFLALNTPKFFLLFGSLALVYALAHALAPRAYGRLREAQMALRLMMKPFVSLGARYKRARSRRTKKRERRARFEAMRQDRQALLKAEKLQRLARLAQEEDTPVVATSETVYKDARDKEEGQKRALALTGSAGCTGVLCGAPGAAVPNPFSTSLLPTFVALPYSATRSRHCLSSYMGPARARGMGASLDGGGEVKIQAALCFTRAGENQSFGGAGRQDNANTFDRF
jgi:hypothetical protein